jgi:hypothetical protein
MSIQLMTFPPKIVPRAFVSDGKTISVMVTDESCGDLGARRAGGFGVIG